MEKLRSWTAGDFWARVDQSGGPAACWPWMLATDVGGYGRVNWHIDGRRVMLSTHSLAFFLVHGWRPSKANGFLVRHSCDNPPCCNPAHLCHGTDADNVRDMFERGRNKPSGLKGEACPWANLTSEDVHTIRERYKSGETQVDIAAEYGLRQGSVSKIVTGLAWGSVPGASEPRPRLADASAQSIRTAVNAGATQRSMAKFFGVSESAISLIMRNKTHVRQGARQ